MPQDTAAKPVPARQVTNQTVEPAQELVGQRYDYRVDMSLGTHLKGDVLKKDHVLVWTLLGAVSGYLKHIAFCARNE